MKAYLAIHKSPLSLVPDSVVGIAAGQTFVDYLLINCPSFDISEQQPVTVFLNGKLFLSENWSDYQLKNGDRIDVRPLPQGLETLLLASIIAVAVAAIALSLVDIPDIDTVEQSEQSPTYSTDIQVNKARLGAPIPDRYGRRRFAPDIAHDRYREFYGNDEYWYLLLSIGQGSYQYHEVTIGETSIDNFDDVEYQFYEPGQSVSLFRSAVYSAPEVAGEGVTLFGPNESDYTGLSGPYILNQVGTLANEVALDFDLPSGLGYSNDKGGIDYRSVSVFFEYREIDDGGDPLGSAGWQPLLSRGFGNRTFDRLRYTQKVTLNPGRYEVRGRRTNNSSNSHREKDEIRWVGLRAYLDDDNTFDHSTLAVKIRSSAQLSAKSERRILVECTRMLPSWNGSAWVTEAATRNPAWAFVNILKAEYGGDYTDANLVLDEIKTFADGCDARGDYYDGHFDTKGTLWPNLQQVLATARAVPILLGSRYTVVRDEPKVGEIHHFSARHIVRDSASLRYKTMDHWADDSVEIEYTDPGTWKPAHILGVIPGSTARKPQKVRMPWITNAVQAHREATFLAAKMAWRTRYIDFKTELEGRFLTPLSPLLVVQEFVEWGSGGDVLHQAGQILTLSEPPIFSAVGDHYIWLRDRRGRSSDALQVTAVIDSDDKVQVLDALPNWIYTEGDDFERTAFAFGSAESQPREMLLERGSPAGGTQVSLTAVVDDQRVHQYDAMINSGVIVTPVPPPAAEPIDLTIRSVQVVQGGTTDDPILRVAWSPVSNAKRYFIDVSYDDLAFNDVDKIWTRIYTGTESFADLSLKIGVVDIRIAAQDGEIGAWYEFTEDVGNGFDVPLTPSGLQLTSAFVGRTANLEWQSDITAVSWVVELTTPGSTTILISRSVSTPAFMIGVDEALLNGLTREFDVHVFAVNTNNVRSAVPALLTIKNNQMPAVSTPVTIVSFKTLHVTFDYPSESDYAGFRVWLGTTPSFDINTAPRFEQLDRLKSHIDIPIETLQTYYVRIAAFDAWGTDELTLSGEIADIASGIRDSDLAQSLSERIALIDTPTTGLLDRLVAEENARDAGDTGLQTQIDSLQVSSNVAIYIQPSQPTGTIDENSRWFDSDDGNKPYIYKNGAWTDVTDQRILINAAAITAEQVARISANSALAARATALEATVDDPVSGTVANRAAILVEQTARADADSALATDVSTLQVTVDGHTSSIQTQSTAIAGIDSDVEDIKLEYSVKLDVNGYVSGFGQFNNGPGASGFIVHADQFAIGHPSTPGLYPFVVQGGLIFMNSAFITDLDVSQLTGDVATFIDASLGNAWITNAMIGNVIQSDNWHDVNKTGWKLDKSGSLQVNNITVYDSAGDVILESSGSVDFVSSQNKINASNASTYIEDLAVDTLQLANNTIFVPRVTYLNSGVTPTAMMSNISNQAAGPLEIVQVLGSTGSFDFSNAMTSTSIAIAINYNISFRSLGIYKFSPPPTGTPVYFNDWEQPWLIEIGNGTWNLLLVLEEYDGSNWVSIDEFILRTSSYSSYQTVYNTLSDVSKWAVLNSANPIGNLSNVRVSLAIQANFSWFSTISPAGTDGYFTFNVSIGADTEFMVMGGKK